MEPDPGPIPAHSAHTLTNGDVAEFINGMLEAIESCQMAFQPGYQSKPNEVEAMRIWNGAVNTVADAAANFLRSKGIPVDEGDRAPQEPPTPETT